MTMLGFGHGVTAGFGSLLAELFPQEIRSTMMGFTYNFARAAQLVAPVAVQAAAESGGILGGMMVPTGLAFGTALWVWVLPETKGIVLRSLRGSRSMGGENDSELLLVAAGTSQGSVEGKSPDDVEEEEEEEEECHDVEMVEIPLPATSLLSHRTSSS